MAKSTFPSVSPATPMDIPKPKDFDFALFNYFDQKRERAKIEELSGLKELGGIQGLLSNTRALSSINAYGVEYPIEDANHRIKIITDYNTRLQELSNKLEQNDPFALREIQKLANEVAVDITSGPLFVMNQNYNKVKASEMEAKKAIESKESKSLETLAVLNNVHDAFLDFQSKGGSIIDSPEGKRTLNEFTPGSINFIANPLRIAQEMVQKLPELETARETQFGKAPDGFYGKALKVETSAKYKHEDQIRNYLETTKTTSGLEDYYRSIAYAEWRKSGSKKDNKGNPVVLIDGIQTPLDTHIDNTLNSFINDMAKQLSYVKSDVKQDIVDTGQYTHLNYEKSIQELAMSNYYKNLNYQLSLAKFQNKLEEDEENEKDERGGSGGSGGKGGSGELFLSPYLGNKEAPQIGDYNNFSNYVNSLKQNIRQGVYQNKNVVDPYIDILKDSLFKILSPLDPNFSKKFKSSSFNKQIANELGIDPKLVDENVKLIYILDELNRRNTSFVNLESDNFIFITPSVHRKMFGKDTPTMGVTFNKIPEHIFKRLQSDYDQGFKNTHPGVYSNANNLKNLIQVLETSGKSIVSQDLKGTGIKIRKFDSIPNALPDMKNIEFESIEGVPTYNFDDNGNIVITINQKYKRREVKGNKTNLIPGIQKREYTVDDPNLKSQIIQSLSNSLNKKNTDNTNLIAGAFKILHLTDKSNQTLSKLNSESSTEIANVNGMLHEIIKLPNSKLKSIQVNKDLFVSYNKENKNYSIVIKDPLENKNDNYVHNLNLYEVINFVGIWNPKIKQLLEVENLNEPILNNVRKILKVNPNY